MVKKRVDLIKAVFNTAEPRELIDRNPMSKIVWRSPSRSVEIDISTVPSVAEVFRAVQLAFARRTHGAHCSVARPGRPR